jgi:hypothetical protein
MNRTHRRGAFGAALAVTLAALVGVPAAVLAGKPVKGATYTGTYKDHLGIVLAVSANGKHVSLQESIPPLFCQGGAGGIEAVAKPLAISTSGTFAGTITFRVIHSKAVAKLAIKGKFSGKKVSGSAHSTWLLTKGCNGTTTYTATTTA